MANTGLSKTFSSSPTNNKKGTMSFWIKKSASTAGQQVGLLVAGASGGTAGFYFDAAGKLYWYLAYTGSWQGSYTTNRVFKDTSAWFHIVQSWDTTQGTASERMKLYVNGVQETSFSSISYPPQDQVTTFGNATTHYINYWSNSSYFDGSMSHMHFCDGYAYAASDFGSFDSTTGEWKIKTSPSVSYGTNGFFILKDGNSLTDQSPNSNDWAVATGTLTKTEDNPSNNFNTFNPLVPKHANLTLSHGNTTLSSTNSQWLGSVTTIPLFGGKWYYECKYNTGHNIKLSIMGYKADMRHFATANQSYGEYNDNGYGYQFNNSGNDYLGNNDTTPNWGGGLSSNSGNKIYMVAINLENGKIWYGADGTWFNDASGNTGNPSSDAHPHQTISATHLAQTPFLVTGSVEGNGATMNWNFGNGYFGTTQISSEGTNASGIGKFEYDVPTGFTAISTKGLNE